MNTFGIGSSYKTSSARLSKWSWKKATKVGQVFGMEFLGGNVDEDNGAK